MDRRTERVCRFPLWLGTVVLATGLAAQIPDGHYVVSAITHYYFGGGGGLWVVDPRVPGNPVPITGLSEELTGTSFDFEYLGANCVEVRQSDGTLFVGEFTTVLTPGREQVDLHVIKLQGLAVQTDTKINLGACECMTMSGAIDQIAVLPGGDLVVVVNGVTNAPPLNGARLARIDPDAGTVTPIPLTPIPPGYLNAMAVDPSGTVIYFATVPPTGGSSDLYRVAITGGIPQLLLETGSIAFLNVDKNGHIYFGNPIKRMDPATLEITQIALVPRAPNGLAIERATQNLTFVVNQGGPQGNGVYWLTQAGTFSRLGTVPSGGSPTGIAIVHDPWSYGSPTPGQSTYTWQTEPSPGGLPRIGNASFGLQLTATPGGNAAGALLAAAARGSTQVAGIELLLDLSTLVFAGPVPASGAVPLPLPDSLVLVGAEVFFQSVHVDGGGLAASDGLHVTLLR